jgi:hypothetical protein
MVFNKVLLDCALEEVRELIGESALADVGSDGLLAVNAKTTRQLSKRFGLEKRGTKSYWQGNF